MRPPFHCAVSVALLAGVAPAAGHGLGERYDLPLPLGLYLSGAALVVALSFLVPAALARMAPKTAGRAPSQFPGLKIPHCPGARALAVAVRSFSVALFILLLTAGFFGNPNPFKNPLPVSVWIIGWVGIAYVSALLGNIWALINPWDNLFRLGEWIARRAAGRPLQPLIGYPAFLEAWPAVTLFFVFAWMELVWPDRDRPVALAWAILLYSVITWSAMAAFGRRIWLENGEAFAVAFGLLARFAVIGRLDDRENRIVLRPPAIGLLVRSPVAPSIAAFALLMLATVTFDGLLETPLWAAISDRALATPLVTRAADILGLQPHKLLATVALIMVPLIFAAIYLAVAHLMALAVSAGATSVGTSEMARLFVLTVVPIAIAYHLSHYLSYLLIAGQFIIPIASDPFALGWNLFGTRLYLVDFSVIDARFVWYASLALIVAGHVIAVWLAHFQAARCLPDRRSVQRSQIPMLALMIGYTAVSLWILAQPITKAEP
jgi:hypothetical protein